MKSQSSESIQSGGESAAAATRRRFIGSALAAASLSPLAALPDLGEEASAAAAKPREYPRKIRLGLVGCGRRGNWITDFFNQHGGYQFHAVADYFQDAADARGTALGIDKSRRFSGLSGYKKMIDSGIEAIVIQDVPYFYPEQAKVAVEAGCHVYMAKPIAVDVPGCFAIEAAAKAATAAKRCFLVDYQLPLDPANIEVANRIRQGALGRLAHILSFGNTGAAADPPLGSTIENRLHGCVWMSDVALGGDAILFMDIHIIDGVTWVTGKRAAGACGRSRICRPNPNGDRIDACGVIFEYDDGVLWTHVLQALGNNPGYNELSASLFGLSATAYLGYGGGYGSSKVYVRGGGKHYVGKVSDSIYNDGAQRNIADFYRNITEGHFENPTAQRAVDGTLTAILGREAAARRRYLSMEELIRENKTLKVNLSGLKA